jgi:hypothetical protein
VEFLCESDLAKQFDHDNEVNKLTYQKGSDHMVNMSKSAIFFNSNCEDQAKESFKQIMNIQTEALGDKYLRLPIAVGRSTKEVFEPIPTKIRGLVNGWGEKMLSGAAGKLSSR